jgi:hypothetical protein
LFKNPKERKQLLEAAACGASICVILSLCDPENTGFGLKLIAVLSVL